MGETIQFPQLKTVDIEPFIIVTLFFLLFVISTVVIIILCCYSMYSLSVPRNSLLEPHFIFRGEKVSPPQCT